MQIRGDVQKRPGGDFIQLLKTKEQLEKLGLTVDVSHNDRISLSRYDLVHLFNVTRITETYYFLKNALAQGKPVVLSPIYHSLKDMQDFYRSLYRVPGFDILTYLSLKEIYYPLTSKHRVSFACIADYKRAVQEVVAKSAMILPNSYLEFSRIEKELALSPAYRVIPNAADGEPTEKTLAPKQNFILCVGRIEPRKNPLSVIRAFNKVKHKLPKDAQLILIGAVNPSHKKYMQKAMTEIQKDTNRIRYLGYLPHHETLAYFRKARLLVLASFFETTGLVGLEALSCDCNVVMTERGYTKEYFADLAAFCNPYSLDSISRALLNGFYGRLNKANVAHALNHFNWQNAAKLTLAAYEDVLKGK
jgi:glycosyltransferase involved in cell wall biosynthesis